MQMTLELPQRQARAQNGVKNWRMKDRHAKIRHRVLQHIHQLLLQKAQPYQQFNGAHQNPAKISKLAKWFENVFYQTAQSLEEYMELSTLQQRIQAITVSVFERQNMLVPPPSTLPMEQQVPSYPIMQTMYSVPPVQEFPPTYNGYSPATLSAREPPAGSSKPSIRDLLNEEDMILAPSHTRSRSFDPAYNINGETHPSNRSYNSHMNNTPGNQDQNNSSNNNNNNSPQFRTMSSIPNAVYSTESSPHQQDSQQGPALFRCCTSNKTSDRRFIDRRTDRQTLLLDIRTLGEMMRGVRPISPGFTEVKTLTLINDNCRNPSCPNYLEDVEIYNILVEFTEFMKSGGCRSVESFSLYDVLLAQGQLSLDMLLNTLSTGCCPKIHLFCVDGSDLGNSGADCIAKYLANETFPCLEILAIKNSKIQDTGISSIAWALSIGVADKLREVYFNGNEISDQGAGALGAAFRSFYQNRLEVLDLKRNPIKERGIVSLLKVRKAGFVPHLRILSVDAEATSSLRLRIP